ncbi:hypothetical protein OXYTRIMIC_015 [Oxytricha trifallax]|uniref:Uncharacterized protein n=1 Tax=Oxytricha trifallax TaxID=1172189 RepID=A0A073I0E9_9SPIT|nr:hypothetical protein OXYTRIMIC_015 [Oxytricha trifallax]
MKELPFPDQVLKQVVAPKDDKEIISAAFSWVVLRGPRTRLNHFKTLILKEMEELGLEESVVGGVQPRGASMEDKFGKVLLQIENNLFSFFCKMLEDNPTIPFTLLTKVMRMLSQPITIQFKRGFETHIRQQLNEMVKNNDPRETPSESKNLYLEIVQIIKNL